jgi:hypothetical protein
MEKPEAGSQKSEGKTKNAKPENLLPQRTLRNTEEEGGE